MLVDIPRYASHYAALDGGSYASPTSLEGRQRAMDSGVVGIPDAANPSRDRMEVLVRSITRPWAGLGGSVVSTATPAAAAVRLLARGSVTAAGALPPERCLEPEEMFAELEQRGVEFEVRLADKPNT